MCDENEYTNDDHAREVAEIRARLAPYARMLLEGAAHEDDDIVAGFLEDAAKCLIDIGKPKLEEEIISIAPGGSPVQCDNSAGSAVPSLRCAPRLVRSAPEVGRMTGIESRRLAGGGVSYVARVRRGGVNRSAAFDGIEEAAGWRAQALAAVRTGTDLPARPKPAAGLPVASTTVEDACRELIRGMRSGMVRDGHGRIYKPATTRAYEGRLRLHVLPLIGGIPLTALRRGDVRRMVDELAVRESPRVAAGAIGALRVVLRRQLDLEVVAVNVCTGVRVPAAETQPARFLTLEESDRLQAMADQDVDAEIGPFVALGLATGMRRGELEALPWGPDGLDVAAGVVGVDVTRDRSGQVVATKNRKARTVPLGPETVARMRRWRLASGRPKDGARVFPAWPEDAWERARTAAGLTDPQPRFHDLRHTAATFFLAAGLRSHAVAELLGHSDAGLVDRLYGHALPDEVNGAGVALEAWIATRIATRGQAG